MTVFEEINPESEPTVAAERIIKAWEAERLGMGILPEDSERLARATREHGEMPVESRLAEAAIGTVAPMWLRRPGDKNTEAFTMPTEKFDDVINHTDVVREIVITNGRAVTIRWGEDITRRHSGTHNLRNEEEMHKKVEIMRDCIQREEVGYSRDAGRVKYFHSPAGMEIGAEVRYMISMPRAIISLADEVIAELAELHYELELKTASVEERKKTRDAILNHPARIEYLSQILLAMEAQISLLKSKHEKSQSGEFRDALLRAEWVIVYVKRLLGDNHEVRNEWLEGFYKSVFGEFKQQTNGSP
jgi:hypothetical protein